MAFCDLKPVSVTDENTGLTYIIGSVFSVCPFGANSPKVYSWGQVRSVSASRAGIVVETELSAYTLKSRLFSSTDEYLRAIALIECAYKKNKFD